MDPQARHARKSPSARRDGDKAHVSAEPDTGLICAVEVTAANVSDAETGPRLLAAAAAAAEAAAAEAAPAEAATSAAEAPEVLADSAYASGPALESFAAGGWETTIKPIERAPRIAGSFDRDDFTINTETRRRRPGPTRQTAKPAHKQQATTPTPRHQPHLLTTLLGPVPGPVAWIRSW